MDGGGVKVRTSQDPTRAPNPTPRGPPTLRDEIHRKVLGQRWKTEPEGTHDGARGCTRVDGGTVRDHVPPTEGHDGESHSRRRTGRVGATCLGSHLRTRPPQQVENWGCSGLRIGRSAGHGVGPVCQTRRWTYTLRGSLLTSSAPESRYPAVPGQSRRNSWCEDTTRFQKEKDKNKNENCKFNLPHSQTIFKNTNEK